ncbi:MAG: hypothetical protein WBR26_12490 [Candidatus Acidiferrum sp.]
MKMFRLLVLTMCIATACVAGTRDWKEARVIDTSETDVTGDVRGQKNTVHYTIETQDMVYFVDFVYKPTQHSGNHAPDIAVNVLTKIAIDGRHAYVLDATGKEVKLHIVKKTKK